MAGSFEQVAVGRLTVDGVDHHLGRSDVGHGLQPRSDESLGGIVNVDALICGAAHKHRLDDQMAMKALHVFDDLSHVVRRLERTVYPMDVWCVDGVKLEDVVVYPHQRLAHRQSVDEGRVAEHAHFGPGAELIAQPERIVDDAREVGMASGFAVARKGEHVGMYSLLMHLAQLGLQDRSHHRTGGMRTAREAVALVAALAIDAVESTDFAVGRHEVDAQADA